MSVDQNAESATMQIFILGFFMLQSAENRGTKGFWHVRCRVKMTASRAALHFICSIGQGLQTTARGPNPVRKDILSIMED